MSTTVPSADGFRSYVVEHPARACFHAELLYAVAQHVILVLHDDAPLRISILHDGISNFAQVAFDIELDSSCIDFIHCRAVALEAIMRQCEKWTTQGVKVGDGRRVSMGGSLTSGSLLLSTR